MSVELQFHLLLFLPCTIFAALNIVVLATRHLCIVFKAKALKKKKIHNEIERIYRYLNCFYFTSLFRSGNQLNFIQRKHNRNCFIFFFFFCVNTRWKNHLFDYVVKTKLQEVYFRALTTLNGIWVVFFHEFI